MNKPTKVAILSLSVLMLILAGLGLYAYIAVTVPDFAFSDLFEERAATIVRMTSTPGRLPSATPSAASVAPSAVADPTPEETEDAAPPIDPSLLGKRINILALGYDMSYERSGGNARTDTMMLISVDTAASSIDIISLPRDSYVRLKGGNARNKINAAFSLGGGEENGGFEAACKTVEWTLGGIPVDYYVGVDMNLFKELVDAVGGVDYDVDIAFTMNGRTLQTGFQHLDGQQVLDYARFRKSGRGDIDRIDRQQRVMLAILNQAISAGNILRLPEIIASVTGNLHTNLSLAQIGALGWIAKDIPTAGITRHTLPGVSMTLHDTSYWLIRQEEKREMLKEVFGIEVPIDMSEDAYAIAARAREQEEAERAAAEAVLPVTTPPDPMSTPDPGWSGDPEESFDPYGEPSQDEDGETLPRLVPIG